MEHELRNKPLLCFVFLLLLFLAASGICRYLWVFSSCSRWRLRSGCHAYASHSAGFSHGVRALGCAGFRSCHLRALAVVVQSLSCVRLFVTPWTAACQASLSFTISQSLLKHTSIESVMPSNHLILCHHPPPPPALSLSQHQGLFQ